MIVAIDGPSAAGKGTLARRLAERLGYAYLDTGLLYRAVARRLMDDGAVGAEAPDGVADAAAVAVAAALSAADLQRPGLREEAVGRVASRVAASAAVRASLLEFQRRFAASPPGGAGGAVLDGRDIGTVVCPDAPVKLFVTASEDVRADRRHKELLARGVESIRARVLADLRDRDARDRDRAAAPLRPAEDAVTLDTSGMSVEDVVDAALAIVEARSSAHR